MDKLPAAPAAKARDPLFDNIKAILIFLVVFGHMLVSFKEEGREYHLIVENLYHCIYLFHIPLFVMVTGYYAKKSVRRSLPAIWYSLIPFLIFALIFTVARWFILPEQRERLTQYWFYLPFTYWYLFAVSVWKLLAKPLAKLRGAALPLLILLGLLVGIVISDNATMAIGRTLAFFPYFWIGLMLTPETVATVRKIPKLAGLFGMAVIFAAFLLIKPYLPCSASDLLQMDDAYGLMGITPLEFVGYRLVLYAVATALCFCVIIAAPGKKTFFTYLGGNTIAIYILHGYVVYFAVRNLHWFDGFFDRLNGLQGIAVSFVFAGVMCAVFGLPPITKGYNLLTKKLGGALEKLFTPKKVA